MMTQAKGFRIGQLVKLHDMEKSGAGNAYPLPPGWTDGQPVKVVAFDHGWVTVEGEAGKRADVFIACIDAGWMEMVDGKWRERRAS